MSEVILGQAAFDAVVRALNTFVLLAVIGCLELQADFVNFLIFP